MKTNNKRIIIPDFMIVLKAVSKLRKPNITQLHIETNITYSHLHGMLKELEKSGHVYTEKEGVKKFIMISSLGQELVDLINKMLKLMDINEDTINEYRQRGKIGSKKNGREN